MASVISSSPTKSHLLDIPDDEVQRGRKRRRSSANSPPAQVASTGSTTMRGRGRRRSLSPSQNLSQKNSLPGEEKHANRKSPGRKYQKILQLADSNKRRSQSPSRSRSVGDNEGTPKPRRRQRTRTRSRSHGAERDAGSGKKDSRTGGKD